MKFTVTNNNPPKASAEFYRGRMSGRVYRTVGDGYVDLFSGIKYENGSVLNNNDLYQPVYPGATITIEV